MPRRQAHIALVIAVTTAAACTPDATAPTAPAAPDAASPLSVAGLGYQASILPLQYATAINGGGAVVGTLPNGWAAYYAQGVTTVLALPSDGSATRIEPRDLTDDGRILARGFRDGGVEKGLYYLGPTFGPTVISVPGNPSERLTALAMNGQGVVVGSTAPGIAQSRAFRWSASSGFADITPAGRDFSSAFDISETGEIVGSVSGGGQSSSGYRWNAGAASGMALPVGVGIYQALNGGRALVSHPTFHYAIWSPTSIVPAGPDPATYPTWRMSSSGRFIGSFTDPVSGQQRAWTSIGTGTATVLPVPAGYGSVSAVDVNACGTILGYGTRMSDTTQHVIVWSRSFTCDMSGMALASTTGSVTP